MEGLILIVDEVGEHLVLRVAVLREIAARRALADLNVSAVPTLAVTPSVLLQQITHVICEECSDARKKGWCDLPIMPSVASRIEGRVQALLSAAVNKSYRQRQAHFRS